MSRPQCELLLSADSGPAAEHPLKYLLNPAQKGWPAAKLIRYVARQSYNHRLLAEAGHPGASR